jgi:hypothetical protein
MRKKTRFKMDVVNGNWILKPKREHRFFPKLGDVCGGVLPKNEILRALFFEQIKKACVADTRAEAEQIMNEFVFRNMRGD